MKLSPKQLAKLRGLARAQNELEKRHESRRAQMSGQRDYLKVLKAQLLELPLYRDAELRGIPKSRADGTEIVRRHDTEAVRIKGEIAAADAEMEGMRAQLAEITAVSAPLHELVDRVLRYANLDRAGAGINFGADDRGPREFIDLRASPVRSPAAAP